MRNKKLVKNTISALILQLITIICGFILPRLILESFGSEVNGLISSISQFLQVISFLEMGIGAVVSSSLYKPLSQKDDNLTSKIIVSANIFFNKLGNILLIYVVGLIFIYPQITHQNFDFIYTTILIIAISISSFSRYYFGLVDGLLLTSDQRGYIQYNIQIITLLINTIACVILIKMGKSIQFVKLTTSFIYLARPLIQRIYVNKHYNINRKITYTKEPIQQKWNGIAQHISANVLDSTDTIVLSIFTSLSIVSIYSIYYLVIEGVKRLFLSLLKGLQSYIGELWAKKNMDKLMEVFSWTEWVIHTSTVIIFGCTGMLILPFVQVYTKGITDVNYYQPLFAIMLTIANASYCLRLPYQIIILVAGHYKQTQRSYIIATIINIIISIATVKIWGLVGVAIGTLCAMAYQTIWMAIYNSQFLINWPLKRFLKQLLVDIISVLLCVFFSHTLKITSFNYIAWVILAIKILLIWLFIIIIINSIVYKDKVKKVKKLLLSSMNKHK